MNENRPVQEEDLQAYIDNALDEARRHEIEAYLRNHPEVARRVDGYIAQRQQLRAAFGPVASEPIPPELNLRHMLAARRTRTATPWRLAASVFVALCVGGLAGVDRARRHRAGIGDCRAGPRGHGQLPGLRIRSEPACGDRRERQRRPGQMGIDASAAPA
ncbi:anti-sigma factor family protein [Cupriavidus basilensis]